MVERRTVPHDLFETHIAADFLFEIELLLRQLLLQFRDLAVGKAILNGDGYLTRRIFEKIDLVRQESICLPVDRQNADNRPAAHEWYHALIFQSLRYHRLVKVRRKLFAI